MAELDTTPLSLQQLKEPTARKCNPKEEHKQAWRHGPISDSAIDFGVIFLAQALNVKAQGPQNCRVLLQVYNVLGRQASIMIE
jgi:hypothetical protein